MAESRLRWTKSIVRWIRWEERLPTTPLSVETMKERGVKKVLEQDFFTLEGQYDTILMLMNGIGIVGTLERMPEFFRQLDKILAPGGQVLCDSSDISYVIENEEGMIDIPNEMDYYGEHSFQMQYKDTIGEHFDNVWIGKFFASSSINAARTVAVEIIVQTR